MDLIRTDDPRYDEARTVFNAMIDKRPAVIAQCATPGDVRDALALAATEGYDVAVRAGGHSVAGVSVNDGGIVVDVRPMKQIEVDPSARQVRVGAGVTWGEFDRATQEHGLATTGGRVSTTGVAGLTLGGGSGWLERSFGLTCDNLVSVDLVTADGREVTASAQENPDLFWALHGGGGNFGVATSFVFALHPVGPDRDRGPDDVARRRGPRSRPPVPRHGARRARRARFGARVPDRAAGGVRPGAPPGHDPASRSRRSSPASVDEGAEAVAPFRELAPEVDLVGPMPYADFQCMIDDPPGFHNYWSADYHDTFPDDALDVFVKYGFERQSPLAQQLMIPWGGAVARVADDATPMGGRSVSWITHPFAVWEDPSDSDKNIEWARSFRRDIARYANGGTYLNFIGDEGDDRVRAAYGDEKYARLAGIKGEWDPKNVFRGNQNIKPA